MLIKNLINKYTNQGFNFRNAQNLAAEEIVISKIASSPLVDHVALKGGIAMFNITKNDRRVTQDIDFDLIRYSIDDRSIELFVEKMNTIEDGIKASIDGRIEKLHQEDYQGVRVHLLLTDDNKSRLRIKLDIGVHTYTAIKQERIVFAFESDNESVSIKVNPCEQIFSEKLISLSRLGSISTRYKDIYDMYYLIEEGLLDIKKVREILSLFFASSNRKPNDIFELTSSIIDTLNDNAFVKEASKPASKWIDVDYSDVKASLISFVNKL